MNNTHKKTHSIILVVNFHNIMSSKSSEGGGGDVEDGTSVFDQKNKLQVHVQLQSEEGDDLAEQFEQQVGLEDQEIASTHSNVDETSCHEEEEGEDSPGNDDVRVGGMHVTDQVLLDEIVDKIKQKSLKKIVCMCGAGISVSAGIPDFRSPNGLYSSLAEYNLPYPEAVFEIDFFRSNPRPFYRLSKELYPGIRYKPTRTHYFIKLLHDKGLLQRVYTQNIDSLEKEAGLPSEAVIAAHGNFDTAHCIECREEHDVHYVREAILGYGADNAGQDMLPCKCIKTEGCNGLVKPGIVFFGESLPERFWSSISEDFRNADLLIVMGSSLVVHPFASLIDKVSSDSYRLLINREIVGETHPELRKMGHTKGFWFKNDEEMKGLSKQKKRDVACLGDCDEVINRLCLKLDWLEDLQALSV
jgi:NAD-dependent deacetylase sirtuin 2